MPEIIPLLCLFTAFILLIALSAIDLKHWILPDELNLALAVTGIGFHFMTAYRFLDIQDIIVGGLLGGGLLYTIRFFANRYYGQDSLGLGDVKLLAAAGIWLGPDGVLQAITLGAFAGLIHGLFYAAAISIKNKSRFNIKRLMIPAGPGFCIGIFIAGCILFSSYFMEQMHALFS